MSAPNNRELLLDLGIDLSRIKDHGKTLCPQCSHTRKKKNDPCLSVDIETGRYNCHNGCGFAGKVSSYEPAKVYPRPVFNNQTDLPKEMMDWFSGRGISQQTLLDHMVTHGMEFMPQVGVERNTIQFNYFRGGTLINIKYRDGAKNFKMFKDAELIFYNLDAIKDADECIITEGEIDTLSWHEAGYLAAISVPNGASGKVDDPLLFLDNCFKYFENKKRIYLAVDDDEVGRILQNELGRRLGYDRCLIIDYEGLKDSNAYLVAHGPDALMMRKARAREFPIEGVHVANDIKSRVRDLLHNGLPQGCRTGDKELDEHLRFLPGELTMITGIPTHGKSIWLDQVALKLQLRCGWKFGIFSPESYPMEVYIARLTKFLTGRRFSKDNLSDPQLDYVLDWLSERSFIINPSSFVLDVILDKARQLVLRKGIKGLIIDPWNRIESTRVGSDELGFIKKQLTKIINFAQAYGVHVFCVAHPTKQRQDEDGVYDVPTLYSISGSADFFNMTQNGVTVYLDKYSGITQVHVQKVKWEHVGKKGIVEYRYCQENGRLYSDGGGEDPLQSWIVFPDELIPDNLPSAMQPNYAFDQGDEPPF